MGFELELADGEADASGDGTRGSAGISGADGAGRETRRDSGVSETSPSGGDAETDSVVAGASGSSGDPAIDSAVAGASGNTGDAQTDSGPSTDAGCSSSCENSHGTAECIDGVCVIDCDDDYADCDGPENGCETSLMSDPLHCGSCNRACDADSQTCVDGDCETVCPSGFGECDDDLDEPCETNVDTSASNCGYCGNVCATDNGTAGCTDGNCEIFSCDVGYDDCDGRLDNGCETDLTTTNDCGECSNRCTGESGTAICTADGCSTVCDLSGTFAIRLTVDVTWANTPYVSGGSGTLYTWLILRGTQAGNEMTGTVTECGKDVPHYKSSLLNEWYKLAYQDAIYDNEPAYLPSVTADVTLSDTFPGATFTLGTIALLMGATIPDPINDPWPGSASGLTQLDMDGDGKPGVSVLQSNSDGNVYPPTSASLLPNHADTAYVGARIVFALNGTLTSCTQSSGAATVSNIGTRIFGCKRSGSSTDCNASEGGFLDTNQVDFQATSATYALAKIADTGTCADVRTALP